jgi:uncharacterized protein YdhG (YjbR/CyaY superfamily)
MKQEYKTIDEYIAQFPEEIRKRLEEMRQTIKQVAPEAVETISYQMPAFRLNGILVYFAAFKDHIGFFPTASGVAAFKEEVTGYMTSRGTIQFPLDKPIPFDLVKQIVQFRKTENLAKQKKKFNGG